MVVYKIRDPKTGLFVRKNAWVQADSKIGRSFGRLGDLKNSLRYKPFLREKILKGEFEVVKLHLVNPEVVNI